MKLTFFISLWLIAAQCKQAPSTASTKQDDQQDSIMTNIEMKFKTAPVTMVATGDEIFLADLNGFFGWSKHLDHPAFIHDTGLSRILAVRVNDKVATIGQWLPTFKTWSGSGKAPEIEIPVFTGKASAMAAYGNAVWIAGADKDTSATALPKKDNVPLLHEKIIKIELGAGQGQVNTGLIGRVKHLCAGEDWLLFSEQDKPETIAFFKNEKLRRIPFPGGRLTALNASKDKVILGSQNGLWSFDPASMEFELLVKSKEDEPVPLQVCVVKDKTIVSTSEGIWRTSGKQLIGRPGKQPYAISAFKNSLLILWPNGELEQWNTESPALEKSIKLPVE